MTNTRPPAQNGGRREASGPSEVFDEREVRPPRDHEAASIALAEVQQWLQRLDLIRDMGHSGDTDVSVVVSRRPRISASKKPNAASPINVVNAR